MMPRLALVGLGRWGTNIKKTLERLGGEVVVVEKGEDISPKAAKFKGINGVLVATPGSTHAEIALPFIKKGLPVFIEKPMTTNLKDALRLQKAAEKSGSKIFVGHLHLYNPAFLKAKELIQPAGKIRYVSFEGMNWGPIRSDMSAWWDWAPHDISMALELFGKPKSVQAWGTFDWAEAKLAYKGFSVLIHVTWLSPEKRKKMTVVGEKSTVVLNDTQSETKLTLVSADHTVLYPEYEATMPLTAEMKAFLEMVESGKQPKTDVQNGVDVVSILVAGERSMKLDGKVIRL